MVRIISQIFLYYASQFADMNVKISGTTEGISITFDNGQADDHKPIH